VPGDYNLTFLDYVEPAGIHWVGNCNELNAAYAYIKIIECRLKPISIATVPVLSLFEIFRIFTTSTRFLATAASEWQVRKV
jgi:hypothetical protein